MPRLSLLALSVLLAAGLSACDASGPEAETQTVVSALLEAGQPFPDVRLSRTVPLGEVYDSTATIPDAAVEVQRLGPDGGVEAVKPYVYRADRGRYVPDGTHVDALVLPGRTYRLRATARGATLTAETTVPAEITLVQPPPARLVYQADPLGPQLRITTSSTAGRQAVYVATTQALEADDFERVTVGGEVRFRSLGTPGRFLPVPLARQFADCDEADGRLLCEENPREFFTQGTSPIINEASYVLPGDGTAVVNVPWIAFGFYGRVDVALVALDAALESFVETQSLQQNPTTISPGEIPNVTTNVVGGVGVFGSFARVTVRTTITER